MMQITSEQPGPDRAAARRDRLDMLANVAIIVACLVVAGAAMAMVIMQWRSAAIMAASTVPPTAVGETPPPPPPVPNLPIRMEDAAALGAGGARVLLVMFSDFECPFCRAFALNTLAALDREYFQTGRVRLIFRHLPLEAIHPQALGAAVAAECARRQGKFWEMHDALIAAERHEFDDASITGKAGTIGLDLAAFASCAASDGQTAVRRDLEEAGRFGLTGTPGFIIGAVEADGSVVSRRRLSGAKPTDSFRAALDEVLAEVVVER
jgi:protein-disulfide isomerase